MLKKIVNICLFMLVIICLSWSTGKQEAGKMVFLRMYYPVGVAGPLAKLMDEMVDDYNASQNEIYVESIFAGGYRNAMEKAQTAFLAGKPPEFAVLDAPTLLTLRDINAIVSLDSLIANEGGKSFVDEFLPAFMKIAQHEGKIWSIPWQRSTPVFYYNTEYFREAGLDATRAPGTWTEMAGYAEKLKKAGDVTRWGLEFPIDFWLIKPMILQAGGELDNQAGTRISLDTAQAREAFSFLKELAYQRQVMPAVRQWGEAVNDFVTGVTAMLYNSTGALTYIRTSIEHDFDVGFLPAHKRQVVIEGGGNFFIFKTTERNQAAAWEVIKWMTRPENTARWSLGSGYVPVKHAAFEVPEYKKYTNEVPRALVAYKQLTTVDIERNMMTHRVNEIVDLVDNTIEEILGGADMNATLKRAQAEADKILSKWQ
ncbi:MAG: ABC transporter substrate-binding protein [Spirochaetaceae bacterium]|nr:MAG: ABC transporter substrate-binding protein [Spirochaetaceae bacterium]